MLICPEGTFSWANVDIVNKNITLQGTGVGQTRIWVTAPGGIEATSANTKAFRITGFTFASTANFGTDNGKAMMRIQGGKGWRIDHNRFEIFSTEQNYNGGNGIYTRNDVAGVIDHNEFTKGGGSGCMHASTYPEGTGATAWSWPSQVGSAKHTVFIEDNIFLWQSTGAQRLMRHFTELYVSESTLLVLAAAPQGTKEVGASLRTQVENSQSP